MSEEKQYWKEYQSLNHKNFALGLSFIILTLNTSVNLTGPQFPHL